MREAISLLSFARDFGDWSAWWLSRVSMMKVGTVLPPSRGSPQIALGGQPGIDQHQLTEGGSSLA
jgi:hypothetical protein